MFVGCIQLQTKYSGFLLFELLDDMHVNPVSLEVVLGQLPQHSTELQLEHADKAYLEHARITPLEHGDKALPENGIEQSSKRADKAPTMTIKQILAQLDGVFPMICHMNV